ncbi:MAG: GNAT family N-acetyltransferase [Deltaproteobacteria bacterium]|nr:GNAT family N-acetyltransferase [Deltaproteobacteria bacterium]
MMEPFETERLLMRPLEAADLDDLFALYRDPRVMKYITGEPRSRSETVAALERHLEDHRKWGYGLCAAIHKADGKLVGRCGLIPWRFEGPWPAEIAWLFAPAYWGKGLGTEFGREMLRQAWGPLNLDSLVARTYTANQGSVNIMHKLGMTLASSLPDEVFYEICRPAGDKPRDVSS